VRRTARRLRGAREVHLTSAAGTDLSFSLEGRDWISEDTGLCTRKGTVTTLPAGELFIAVVEGSASGRLVVDVHFEERLRGPATVQIADGTASRIVGAQAAVDAMNRGGKDGRALGRFGFGLNPQARVMGPHLEAEKAVGSAHLGFGDNLVIGGKIHPGVRVECILSEVRGGRQGRDRERATRRVSSAVVEHAVEAVLLRGLLEPPENRELVPALLALVVLAQVPAGDVEPVSLDRDRAAARTVRVLETMARDVPDVDVLQALLLRDRAVLLERLDG